MYKVDVTVFHEPESEEGFPKNAKDERGAYTLFYQTILDLYSTAKTTGPYTVFLYCVGRKGVEVPLLTQLVNVPRR